MVSVDMYPVSKQEYETLVALRSGMRKLMHGTENHARQHGISPQQHQLLLAIKGRPGKDWASASEIATALQLRHNSVVGLIDRAARQGLVERRSDPHDGRLVQVHLTPAGEQLLATLTVAHREELRRLSSELIELVRRLQK